MFPKIATFEDVKNIKPDEYLIDVRNPDELEATGSIPHSINIPLKELAQTLDLSGEDFKKKVGAAKPRHDDRIIITCRSGARAEKAAIQLTELQYKNVLYYKGSWNEWAAKMGTCAKSSTGECM